MESTALLLCDEKLLPLSPLCSPVSSIPLHELYFSVPPLCGGSEDTSNVEDYEQTLKNYMQREPMYTPRRGYIEKLYVSTHLSAARCRVIRWIVLACRRHHLGFATAFNAVNYLDRFVSMNCCTQWEGWMMELLSIACLSIASKFEEVVFPSLHDFEFDDTEHSFQPGTIQQMELAVLKALDWRIACITPYSYLTLLMPSLHSHLTPRTTDLLLCALIDVRFLEHRACVVAASLLREICRPAKPCAKFISIFTHLIPQEGLERAVEKCCKILMDEEQYAKKYGSPPSPVTVIPMQISSVWDCYADGDVSFLSASESKLNIKKRKREA